MLRPYVRRPKPRVPNPSGHDGADAVPEGVGRARRSTAPRRPGAPVRGPASGARGDVAAGVRGVAAGGAPGASAGADGGDGGPQRPPGGPRGTDRHPIAARQLEAPAADARGFRGGLFDLPSPPQGILALIGRIGTAGATGHVIEYTGDTIRALSMEERMTVCNMSIEAGARAGMIAPDEKTLAYLAGRPRAPSGAAWDRAVARWRELRTDSSAKYDTRVELDASEVAPQVTWGTSPGMVTSVTGRVPSPADFPTDAERRAVTRALEYMGLTPGTPLEGLPIERVFLGSCTNARIEDLRAAARTVRGRHVATGVRAMVVPGSQQVKAQAEREGLDRVFSEAGFEWRNAGCSMCLGMNPDVLQSGERCASTSNRNFEGRQGRGGRTHLMSPPMAAAAAVAGHIVDVREWAGDLAAR